MTEKSTTLGFATTPAIAAAVHRVAAASDKTTSQFIRGALSAGIRQSLPGIPVDLHREANTAADGLEAAASGSGRRAVVLTTEAGK
jgi:hypothetical protein